MVEAMPATFKNPGYVTAEYMFDFLIHALIILTSFTHQELKELRNKNDYLQQTMETMEKNTAEVEAAGEWPSHTKSHTIHNLEPQKCTRHAIAGVKCSCSVWGIQGVVVKRPVLCPCGGGVRSKEGNLYFLKDWTGLKMSLLEGNLPKGLMDTALRM